MQNDNKIKKAIRSIFNNAKTFLAQPNQCAYTDRCAEEIINQSAQLMGLCKHSPTLYLVVYIGMYDGSEGDHSHYLFADYKDAVKQFKKCVKECKAYYKNELKVKFNVFDDADTASPSIFSLHTLDGNDKVDIYIQPIKCDGSLFQIAF